MVDEIDLGRLSRSTRVIGLGTHAHGYLWLLKAMWMNGGFLPDNDRMIAGLMRLDERSWKRTYKPILTPMLTRLPDSTFGAIFTKKRLVEIMIETASIALANRDRTAKATAARQGKSPAKSKQPANVTSNVTKPTKANRDDERDVASTVDVTSTSKGKEEKEALLSSSRELLSPAPTVEVAALPPRANGSAGGSADVGSPGLGGRSPPQPSEKVKVPPMQHGDIRPSPALLNTPLVRKARTGLMAALDSEEDD